MSSAAEHRVTVSLTRTIVLVGLMGAGKTSVGKRLARFLDVPFHDSDHEVEAAADLSVREIFERYGEAEFRSGETRVVQRLLSGPPGVLATGGGAFLSEATRAAIAAQGVSVWINASLDTLWSRVKDKPTRPLLQQPEPRKILSQLLEDRRPIYATADVEVASESGLSHDIMVRRILKAIRTYDLSRPDTPAALQKDLV